MSEKLVDVPYLPLERWALRWELDGIQVRCKACRALQASGHSGYAFNHRLDCPAYTTAAQ